MYIVDKYQDYTFTNRIYYTLASSINCILTTMPEVTADRFLYWRSI